MSTQQELDRCYMKMAICASELSKAKRSQVGSVLVTAQGVVVPGVNGMYSGGSNVCEDMVWNTKPEVIHSELNCLLKCAKEGVSCLNSTIYITLSPCLSCSSMIIQSGIKRVVYLEEYRVIEGLQLLKDAKVLVEKFKF